MTLQQIFSDTYLTNRAAKAVKDSLAVLKDNERQEFAADALQAFEANGARIEILDELYLASL